MDVEKLQQLLSTRKVRIGALLISIVSIIIIAAITFLDTERDQNVERSQQAYQERIEKNPILSKLPYKNTFFSVEPRNEGGEIVLYVFSSIPYQRSQAVKTINQLEQNASSKYRIVFYNFKNPLTTDTGVSNE
ncbi:MAG: hypothetical protein ACTJG2_04180 [Candidatus Saccharimonadales bacterium]